MSNQVSHPYARVPPRPGTNRASNGAKISKGLGGSRQIEQHGPVGADDDVDGGLYEGGVYEGGGYDARILDGNIVPPSKQGGGAAPTGHNRRGGESNTHHEAMRGDHGNEGYTYPTSSVPNAGHHQPSKPTRRTRSKSLPARPAIMAMPRARVC